MRLSTRPRAGCRLVAAALVIGGHLAVAACARRPARDGEAPLRPAGQTSRDISEEDVRTRLQRIAHDSMQGRATGSTGHLKLTEHLAAEVSRLGLSPGGEHGTYFQAVPYVRRHLAHAALSAGGEAFTLGRDYVPLHPGGRIREFNGARVVFGGTLQDTARQVTREQAAGRVVILVHQNPNEQAGNIRTASRGHRLETAAAIVTVNSDRALASWAAALRAPRPEFTGDDDPRDARPAALAISARVAALLLGRTADTAVAVGTLGTTVDGEVAFRVESLTVRNVIAILPGSDPRRSAELVALGAHSDHVPSREPVDHDSLRRWNVLARRTQQELGRRFLTAAQRAATVVDVDSLRAGRPARRDSIHNGADDNGSGTAALIEIAEAMSAATMRPARSTLFVWHAAEELGLVGSRYFTEHPTVNRDAIVAYINLDMIGRGGAEDIAGGGPQYLQLIGWRRLASGLADVIGLENRRQALPFHWDLQFDAPGHPEQLYCRSDHASYARFGVPVAFLTTGLHADYHEVTDEAQYLDYPKLTRVIRLVRDIVMALANLEQRLVVDGRRPAAGDECTQ